MTTELKTETKEVDCPHCKGKIDVEIQRSKPKVIISEREVEKITENHVHEPPKPNMGEHDHDNIAKAMPSGVNFARCKDGNCGHKIIKNAKGLTTSFKTCPTCGDNTNAKKSKICKTCGKKPQNEDDWDESDVKIEIDEDVEDDEED